MKKLLLILTMLTVGCTAASVAAPAERPVKIIVAPDHADWRYDCGEQPSFTVTVLRFNCPVPDAEVKYEISEDMMPASVEKELTLKDGSGKIRIGTMKEPGFLRCRVFYKENGYTY